MAEQSPEGRALPHSEETERAVLAVVLLRPELLPELAAKITAQMFYLERHQSVWRAFVAIDDAGSEIDLRTLQAQLESAGDWEQVGGMAYLAGLDLELPDLGRWETYVEIIRERYRRRLAVRLCGTLAKAGVQEEDLDLALSRTQAGLDRIADLGPGVGDAESMEQILDSAMPPEPGASPPTLPSFAVELDRYLPLAPGLTLVAGRPSHGKSVLALAFADHVAHVLGQRVLHFSLEMTGKAIAQRLLAAKAGVDHTALKWGRLTGEEVVRVEDIRHDILQAGCWILDPNFDQTSRSVIAACRHAHAAEALGLVVVDYLGLMDLGHTQGEKMMGLGEAARSLHSLGIEFGIPIVALHQLSRDMVRRGGYNPRLSDLRGCGELEEHSARVFFVSRPWQFAKDELDAGQYPTNDRENPDYVDPRELVVHVRKVRDGVGIGEVSLDFDASRMQLRGRETARLEREQLTIGSGTPF